MSTLAFFPWLRVENEAKFGNYRLIPYERGKRPFGSGTSEQETVDDVLEPYVERGSQPISEATLVRVGQNDLLSDIGEGEANTIFIFSELLAIAGLSKRRFFGLATFEYCNRDIFQVVVQRFSRSVGGATRTYRRRDGTTTSYTTRDALRIHKPGHAVHPLGFDLDTPLLEALLAAQDCLEESEWGAIFESVASFNLANTDSKYVAIQIEPVLLISAFERLLDCGGKEHALASAFTDAIVPQEERRPSSCKRLVELDVENRFKSSESIREVWIRDCFRLRGNLAHGRLDPKYPSLWNLNDHLLLGSFVFPLVLKSRLASLGFYDVDPEDQLFIDVFEDLACEEHCVSYDEPEEYPWNRIIGEAMFARTFRSGREDIADE